MMQANGTGRAIEAISTTGLEVMRAWAYSIKPNCEALEAAGGPPALWTAAQACHESYSTLVGGPSKLARDHFNLWGIKAAEWQQEFGCKAVVAGTFEYVDGKRVDLEDAFCSMPSLGVAFKVYAHLLNLPRYKHALRWRDPLLCGLEIWRSGWATNPAYITGEWGVPFWLKALADDFAKPAPPVVRVEDEDGKLLVEGWLDGDKTAAHVRPLLEALGHGVGWRQKPMTAIVKKGGCE